MEELGLEEENHRRKTEAKEYQIIETIVDEKSYSPNTYYIKNENNEFESTQHFLARHNQYSSDDTLSGIMRLLATYELEPNIYKQISIERSPSDYRRDTQKVKSVDLEDYNVYAERMFKLKVLDWINNGEPKLFRSPAEGNYIVRLLNNSLTPTDTLSRMIHTFNSTAYEIAPFNRANLYAFGFLNLSEPDDKQFQMKTIKLFPKINETTYMLRANEELLKDEIYTLYTNEDVLYKCTKDFEYKKGIFYFLNSENGIYQKDDSDTITEGREYYSPFDDSLTYYTYNTEMGMYVPCLATPREHNNFYYTKDYSTFANSSMWPASYVEFNNVTPGTEVRINNNSYYIGETGTLSVYIKDGIKSVYLPDPRTPNINPVGIRSGSNLQPILYKNSEVYTERTAISSIPYLKDNASLIAYTGLKKNENDTVNYDKVIIGLKATLIKKYVDNPAYDALIERVDTIIDDLINNLKDKYEKFSNAILEKFSKTYTDVYENILKYIEANEIVDELDESKSTSPINQKENILSEYSESYRRAFSSNEHKTANMALQVAKANLDLAKNEVTQLENRIESYKENISNLRAANAKNAAMLEGAEEYNTAGMNDMKTVYIALAKSVKDTISGNTVDTTNLAKKTVKYIGETTDLTYEDLYVKDDSVTEETYTSGKYYYYDYSAKSFVLDTEEQYQSARYWTSQSQSSTGAMTQIKEDY